MHYVYILRSKKDKSIYIGITANLKKRIKEHNARGFKFTTPRRPYCLIWCSVFSSKIKAYRFEKYLKTGSGKAFLRKHLI